MRRSKWVAKQGNCNFPLPSPLRSIKEGGRCTQDSLLVSSCDANHSNIYRVWTMNIWTSGHQLGPLYVCWILLVVLRGQIMRMKTLMLMMMTLIMTMGTTRKSVGFVPGWRGWRRGNRARSARPTDQGDDEDHDNLEDCNYYDDHDEHNHHQ